MHYRDTAIFSTTLGSRPNLVRVLCVRSVPIGVFSTHPHTRNFHAIQGWVSRNLSSDLESPRNRVGLSTQGKSQTRFWDFAPTCSFFPEIRFFKMGFAGCFFGLLIQVPLQSSLISPKKRAIFFGGGRLFGLKSSIFVFLT